MWPGTDLEGTLYIEEASWIGKAATAHAGYYLPLPEDYDHKALRFGTGFPAGLAGLLGQCSASVTGSSVRTPVGCLSRKA